jgi:hypothetical protein
MEKMTGVGIYRLSDTVTKSKFFAISTPSSPISLHCEKWLGYSFPTITLFEIRPDAETAVLNHLIEFPKRVYVIALVTKYLTRTVS